MNWLLDTSGVRADVTDIRWERMHLFITLRVDMGDRTLAMEDAQYYAVYRAGKARVEFDRKLLGAHELELHACVTNNGENQCIPYGIYRIYVCDGLDVLAECQLDLSLSKRLLDCSRIFTYGNYKKAYNVSFFVEDAEEEDLPFRMHIRNLTQEPLTFPKSENWHKQVSDILHNVRYGLQRKVRRMYRKASEKNKEDRKNTVLFMTTQSDELVSNLKAVYEKMLERGLDEKFNILVYAHNTSGIPARERNWDEFIDCVSRAGYIFLDDHVPAFDWLRLKKSTKIIQLWHAGAGFKSSGYNRWGVIGGPAPQSCHRQYAYGITGSKKIANFFADVWGINEEKVIATGMPRMDSYLDPAYREQRTRELRESYPICEGKKVILFAPTFRGKNNATAYYPYDLLDFDKLYEACGDEWVVLFKAHPWVNNELVIEERHKDRFLDVKHYPNINDLFYITDLMITDYSSSIYEYSLMRKPMIFFAFDEEKYSFTRGFHRPYEESIPGKLCRSFDDVIAAIENKDFEGEKVEAYVEHHFDYFDTHASDRVIDWFLLGQMPAEITEAIREKQEHMKWLRQLDFTRPEPSEDDDAEGEFSEKELPETEEFSENGKEK